MARVAFTSHLQRYVDCPPSHVTGETVRLALEQVFATNPRLRGYVLDDQGSVRHHVAVFVDNQPLIDRKSLSDPLTDKSEIYVLQALSGGTGWLINCEEDDR